MRFVIGYLATPTGRDGVALGVLLARTYGAQLDICLVLDDFRPAPSKGGTEASYDAIVVSRAEGWLAEAAALVPDDIVTRTHLVYAESQSAGLNEAAANLDADMLVTGAAGDGLFSRHSIGTVTNALLHSAHLPLVMAPRGFRHDQSTHLREVTCAIGAATSSSRLLSTSLDLAERAELPLRLLSLAAVDHAQQGRLDADITTRRHNVAEAQAILAAARDGLGPDADVTVLVGEGDSVEDAARGLEWHPGDLLVLGSSRLGQPGILFLGTTATRLLRIVPVPIVVVPREAQQ